MNNCDYALAKAEEWFDSLGGWVRPGYKEQAETAMWQWLLVWAQLKADGVAHM